jgi:hypothetical protein
MTTINKFLIQAAITLMTAAGPMAAAEVVPPSNSDRSDTEHLLADASNDIDDIEEIEEDAKDDDWRVNLDVYGFLPLSADTTTTLNGNSNTLNWDLEDIFDHLTGALTMRGAIEHGRWGLQTGIIHASLDGSKNGSSWTSRNRSRNRKLTGNTVTRSLSIGGEYEADFDFDQTILDLALRYRAGDVQRPRMEHGAVSFVGFAGTRIVNGTIGSDIDIKIGANYEGPITENKRAKSIKFDESWSRTWVQPLIGMHTTYAFNPDWQAFVYLDAAGFGLSGQQDLSGTAQAGIAYSIGNSTQLSLSYKYFGLDYQAYGNDNGYDTKQHGVNLGIRILFE